MSIKKLLFSLMLAIPLSTAVVFAQAQADAPSIKSPASIIGPALQKQQVTPGTPVKPAAKPQQQPASPTANPATAPDTTGSGNASPTVVPSDAIKHILEQLGLSPSGQAAAPTPAQLEAFYHSVWEHVGEVYHDTSLLQNWGQWENKYKGQLNTPADLDKALQEMLASLNDQWTKVITADEIAAARKNHAAGIESVGLALKPQANGNFFVVDYVPFGTPAQKSNLFRRGDVVKSIAGKSVSGLTQKEVDALLTGKVGSTVEIVFNHDGADDKATVTIAATDDGQLVGQMLPGNIAYVRYPDFESEDVYEALLQGLVQIEAGTKGNLKGLILDLRGNPGGVFGVALETASVFLEKGTIVTTTTREGRLVTNTGYNVSPALPHEFAGQPKNLTAFIKALYDVPMVVLVDGNSASCAEILTGALKDNHRAIIVGTTTYGKGVGYSRDQLPTGGVITITSLDYLTPSGFNLSHKGITPDVVVDQPRGAVSTDVQLAAAVQALNTQIAKPPSAGSKPVTNGGEDGGGLESLPIVQAALVALFLLAVTLYSVHQHLQKKRAEEKRNKKKDNQ